jgi:hypothetical protein
MEPKTEFIVWCILAALVATQTDPWYVGVLIVACLGVIRWTIF